MNIPCVLFPVLSVVATVAVAQDTTARSDSAAVPVETAVQHVPAGTVDSLLYSIRREELQKQKISAAAAVWIAAAQELAASGLFSDALDLLSAADSAKSGGTSQAEAPVLPAAGISQKEKKPWSVYSSVDYNRIIDTTSDQQHTLDSLSQIGQAPLSPYSAFVKASYDWRRDGGFVRALTPSVYVSDRQTYLQLEAAAQAFNKIALFDATLQAARLYENGFGDDAVDGALKAEATTRPLKNPLALMLPLSVELNRYRQTTSTYFSFAEYKATPALEWSDDDLVWTAGLSAEAGYRNSQFDNGYLSDSIAADSLNENNADRFYAAPLLSIDYAAGGFFLELLGSGRFEKYPFLTDPYLHQDFQLEGILTCKPMPKFEASADITAGYEREFNQKSLEVWDAAAPATDSTARGTLYREKNYRLAGRYVTADPCLKYFTNDYLAVGVRYNWEWRDYPPLYAAGGDSLAAPAYIWESYHQDIPAVGIILNRPDYDGEFWLTYQIEKYKNYKDPSGGRLYPYPDSKAWGFSLRAQWQILDWLNVDLGADYQDKQYVSASLGLRGKF
ncbi:MAG: hypothetical protein PHC61_16470 [Chitinivibrionales bacterium]|nr:hypothetical protein [Chitinivibrionales bacterium]